jgi:hypothetical protein
MVLEMLYMALILKRALYERFHTFLVQNMARIRLVTMIQHVASSNRMLLPKVNDSKM